MEGVGNKKNYESVYIGRKTHKKNIKRINKYNNRNITKLNID